MEMPDPKPLSEASRRLKAGELHHAALVRAHRDALREDRRRTRQAVEHVKLVQARVARDLETVEYWAFREWMMTRRPEPPAVPVPDEPRHNIFARDRTHGYGSSSYRARGRFP